MIEVRNGRATATHPAAIFPISAVLRRPWTSRQLLREPRGAYMMMETPTRQQAAPMRSKMFAYGLPDKPSTADLGDRRE
jgi:hypothetical protein